LLDDMFWPATVADMPLLRELAFTPHQYTWFWLWQAPAAMAQKPLSPPESSYLLGMANIFEQVLPTALQASFANNIDPDQHFEAILAQRAKYAPALIDMAHLGSMLGGSFLPGIEVGREGGIAKNWCLFHGAGFFFPDLRFKPADSTLAHEPGTLTKDLAIPWSFDFWDCDEMFWPTARPGMVLKGPPPGTQVEWLPSRAQLHLSGVQFWQDYWKHLGFIRRDGSDNFLEQESWRP
jgi:hypothetical protein